MRRSEQYYEPWEPQGSRQPQRDNKWLLMLVGGLIGLCALTACGAAAYFFLQPLLGEPPPSPPAVPTLPGSAATATVQPAPPTGEQPPPEEGPPPVQTPVPQDTDLPPATQTPVATPQAVTAVSVSNAATIDGDAGDWPAVPTVTSPYRVFTAEGWDGSEDLQVAWRLAWDASRLYLLARVVDDAHVQTQTGILVYRGDSLEIQVDTDPAANAPRVNPATYQIILSPGNFSDLSPVAVRFRGTSDGRIPEAPNHNIQVAAQQTPQGYTLEAAIPWADLNVTPSPGLVLGLALNANDNDTPGSARQELMMSNVPGRTLTDPRSWGLLRLE